jgi:hypothetical protein
VLCLDEDYRHSSGDSECARWMKDGRWVREIREFTPKESTVIASDTRDLGEGLAKSSCVVDVPWHCRGLL